MEASVEDIEFKDGMFSVAGTDKKKALVEISLAAYVPHPHHQGVVAQIREMAATRHVVDYLI